MNAYGSTVAKRWAIMRLPRSESILGFIRSVWLGVSSRLPCRKVTLAERGFLPGLSGIGVAVYRVHRYKLKRLF